MKSASGTSGANAPVTVTIDGTPLVQYSGLLYLFAILWSYSATPVGGAVGVTGPQDDDITHDIIMGGPGQLSFPPVIIQRGQDLAVTLAAGGGTTVGEVTVVYAFYP